MTPAWAPRREACVSDGRVSPDVFTSMVERLGHCVGSSQRALETEARHRHVHRSLQGLRSHGPGKPAEDSAPVGDVERPGRQAGVGTAPWDHQPVSEVLGGQGAERLGDPKGGSALAPRSFPQRGPPAVGGHRPWWRHRGQGDHCQGGVCMGSVSRPDHAWRAWRLARPAAWARAAPRRQACPVPEAGRSHTRHAPCLARRAAWGPQGPQGWGTGAEACGRHARCRHARRERGERYGLGVPCPTPRRALEAPGPA